MAEALQALFTTAHDELAQVSSSLIKEIAPVFSDEEFSRLLREPVVTVLRAKLITSRR
ncbi:MAG: hypothetical protein ACUVQR_15035 [Thermogutta sp.]